MRPMVRVKMNSSQIQKLQGAHNTSILAPTVSECDSAAMAGLVAARLFCKHPIRTLKKIDIPLKVRLQRREQEISEPEQS